AQGNFVSRNVQVGRHLPPALALIFEPQHEHRETVEGETPDHAERVGFAENVYVAATGENGEELEQHHQVDDAMRGAESRMRMAEPLGEHSIFGDAIQHAV